jgi:hypothetical protein
MKRPCARARIDHDFIYSDMGDRVVHLPKDLGFHYLSLAAEKAAQSGNRDLAADSSEFTDVLFHDARSAQAAVAVTTLEAHLPADFDRVDIAQLAEVRAELAAGRLRYQAAIGALVNELGAVASEGELARVQAAIVEIASEKVHETKAAYDRAKVKTAIEGVGVTLTPPAIATTIASALGIGIFAPAGVAIALSLFGTGAYLKWQEARAAKAASPWSYVLDIASKTTPGPSRQPTIRAWDASMRQA